MLIGLDIAEISFGALYDRMIIVSADTDMAPALELARRKGLQVVGVQLPRPALPLTPSLFKHIDIRRAVDWPSSDISARLTGETYRLWHKLSTATSR